MSNLLKTPLYDSHKALGARMAEFGGWDMPIQYSGILAEHEHTRTKAAIFDICHMGEFELSGPTAESDLERILTQNIASLSVGQSRYGFILNEQGGVIDDVICFRLDTDRFWLVVNAARIATDFEWVSSQVSATTVLTNLSAQIGKIDIQGPQARRLTEEALGMTLPDLGYFRFTEVEFQGQSMLLSRTGYTGEFGYECYPPIDLTLDLWNRLLTHDDILPAGLGARDTLRLEAGYPLYGHEHLETRSPFSVTGGMFLKKSGGYIGAEAAQTLAQQEPRRVLVGITLEGRQAARAHDAVQVDGQPVGEVTSGAYAPSLGFAVAMAMVDADHAGIGTALTLVNSRGKELPGTVVEMPFYKDGSARQG